MAAPSLLGLNLAQSMPMRPARRPSAPFCRTVHAGFTASRGGSGQDHRRKQEPVGGRIDDHARGRAEGTVLGAWTAGASWLSPWKRCVSFHRRHAGLHAAAEIQEFVESREYFCLLAAVLRGVFEPDGVRRDGIESVAPGSTLDLVDCLSQLLPVAAPRRGFPGR